MDRDALIERLRATFVGELHDHAKILEAKLLEIERAPGGMVDGDVVTTLFRSAHSLKGAARAVDLEPIEAACHRLEEIFADVRDRARPLGGNAVQVLLRAVDALRDAAGRLAEKRPLRDSAVVRIMPELSALVSDTQAGATRDDQRPTAAAKPRPEDSPPRESGPRSDILGADRDVEQPEAPAAIAPVSRAPGDASVRVSAERLDMLLSRSGELQIARERMKLRLQALSEVQEFARHWRSEWQAPSPAAKGNRERLKKLERELNALGRAMTDDTHALDEAVLAVDTELRAFRMLRFSEACEGLERMVRDLAVSTGKQIALHLLGGEIELDRSILENLKDPLRHLVRNAIDHGMELPEARRRAGKPSEGTLTVRAALKGSTVEVSVEDDGRGLDMQKIRSHAQNQNLLDLDDDRKLTQVIFLSGFSTSSSVTRLSGRGVGLDVVKSKVESMRGAIEVESTPGNGTRFVLTLPLTLTVLRAVLVRLAERVFAFDISAIERMVRIDPAQLRLANGNHMLPMGDDLVRVASLSQTLGFPGGAIDGRGKLSVVSLAYGQRRAAFLVDELMAEQEIVIQGLGPRLQRVDYFSGATTLASGRVVPVLNAVELIDRVLASSSSEAIPKLAIASKDQNRKRLLVADDSVTTRTLEKSILEAAGYEVFAAADGVEALRLIQEQGVDLVVSDVEMPNMDGFSLTEAIRRSVQFRDLPVILVTARASDTDRMRGLEAGANAYIVKSAFDQKLLLDTVEQVL